MTTRPGMVVPGDTGPFPVIGSKAARGTAEPVRPPVGRLRRSLRAAIGDGIFAEVVTATTQGATLTAWALHLGSSPFVIGLLVALPFLVQPLHLPAAWLTSIIRRRSLAIGAVLLQRQTFVLLIPLPFLPIDDAQKRSVLLATCALSAALGVVGNNAWVAWMGDLIPAELRGRYFGRRHALCTLGGAVATMIVGEALQRFLEAGLMGAALSGLAAAACLAGAASSVCMAQQHDPGAHAPRARVSLGATLQPFRDASARPFLRYQAIWNGAVALAAGFIPAHMVLNLHMGYDWISIHAVTLAFFRVVSAPAWGKILDRVGSRPVLIFCSFGISVLPFIWLLPREGAIWPIFLDAVVSGVMWAGHANAAFALPFALAPKDSRPFYLGAFAAVGGLSYAGASIVAGALADSLPHNFMLFGTAFVHFHVLFALSFAARLSAAFASLKLGQRNQEELSVLVRELAAKVPVPRALRADD